MTLNDFLSQLRCKSKKRDIALADIHAAYQDCKQGYYDKYYRYKRNDNGLAYDIGWTYANQKYKNIKVIFLNEDIILD